jgi:hypothetical protein
MYRPKSILYCSYAVTSTGFCCPAYVQSTSHCIAPLSRATFSALLSALSPEHYQGRQHRQERGQLRPLLDPRLAVDLYVSSSKVGR